MNKWSPEAFPVLRGGKLRMISGWVNGGLGLHRMLAMIADLPMPAIWALYHLGSGHVITFITAEDEDAFAIATQTAALGDWTFDGLYGWRNVAPQLWDDFTELIARNPLTMTRVHSATNNEDGARAILNARETGRTRNFSDQFKSRRRRKPD